MLFEMCSYVQTPRAAEAHEENRENSTLHTLSHGKVNIKGEKNEFQSIKTENNRIPEKNNAIYFIGPSTKMTFTMIAGVYSE